MTATGEDYRFDWRGAGAAAGALIATLFLLGLVFLVAMSNNARDTALEGERTRKLLGSDTELTCVTRLPPGAPGPPGAFARKVESRSA